MGPRRAHLGRDGRLAVPGVGVITQGADASANLYSAAALRGLEFGVRQINAAGGLLGEPIELIVEDDEGKPEAAAAAAGRLANAGVCFNISLSHSVATMAAQEASRGLALLAPCQSGKQLGSVNNPWFWHTGPSSTLQVKTLVAFCKKSGYEDVALVGDESQLSRLLTRAYADEIALSGIRLVGEEFSFSGKAEAVISSGVHVPELLALLRKWRERNGKPPLLGSYNFTIAEVQERAGKLMDGVAYVDAFDPRKPQAQRFVSSYVHSTGKAPGSVEGYGYDAIQLVASAVSRAGGLKPENVRAAMQDTRAPGVMGAIGATYEFRNGGRSGFDPDGLVVRRHGEGVIHVGMNSVPGT
jgi:branched-chain amino acid transport system substrate-binding protein